MAQVHDYRTGEMVIVKVGDVVGFKSDYGPTLVAVPAGRGSGHRCRCPARSCLASPVPWRRAGRLRLVCADHRRSELAPAPIAPERLAELRMRGAYHAV